MRNTRPISWIKAVRRDFEGFPEAYIWVIHAIQKKSKTGIKTPQADIDIIRERLKRLKEALK